MQFFLSLSHLPHCAPWHWRHAAPVADAPLAPLRSGGPHRCHLLPQFALLPFPLSFRSKGALTLASPELLRHRHREELAAVVDSFPPKLKSVASSATPPASSSAEESAQEGRNRRSRPRRTSASAASPPAGFPAIPPSLAVADHTLNPRVSSSSRSAPYRAPPLLPLFAGVHRRRPSPSTAPTSARPGPRPDRP